MSLPSQVPQRTDPFQVRPTNDCMVVYTSGESIKYTINKCVKTRERRGEAGWNLKGWKSKRETERKLNGEDALPKIQPLTVSFLHQPIFIIIIFLKLLKNQQQFIYFSSWEIIILRKFEFLCQLLNICHFFCYFFDQACTWMDWSYYMIRAMIFYIHLWSKCLNLTADLLYFIWHVAVW